LRKGEEKREKRKEKRALINKELANARIILSSCDNTTKQKQKQKYSNHNNNYYYYTK
jgi:hypothetical protein